MLKSLFILFSLLSTVQGISQDRYRPSLREVTRGKGKTEFEYRSKGKAYLISFKDVPNTHQDSLIVYVLKNKRVPIFKSTIELWDTLEMESVVKQNTEYVLIKTAGNRLKVHKLFFGRSVKLVQNV